jgi:hypothetical protein
MFIHVHRVRLGLNILSFILHILCKCKLISVLWIEYLSKYGIVVVHKFRNGERQLLALQIWICQIPTILSTKITKMKWNQSVGLYKAFLWQMVIKSKGVPRPYDNLVEDN